MRLSRVSSLFGLLLLSSSVVACAAEEGSKDYDVAPTPAPTPAPGPVDDPVPSPTPLGNGDPGLAEMPAYLKTPATSKFMTGVEMGTPFDSIIDEPSPGKASAIASGFALEDVPGQIQATANIRRIETTEDLYSALEISASLDVKGAVWGVSASASFAKERTLHSEYLYLLVDASAVGRTQRIAKPALTEEAKKLGAKAFYAQYGDRYASSIVTGQQIWGIIEIRTRSLSEKESLALSLGVSYGASSFSSSFKSTLATATTNIEKHVSAGAFGTTPPIQDDIDVFINAVDTKFNEFTSSKADPGTQTLLFRYSSYYGLDGYPGVPANAEAKVLEHARAASDFQLYGSLLGDYTRRGYDVADPILAGMKTYTTALDVYLAKSRETTPELPARPAIAQASKLESFAKISENKYPGTFTVHAYENGFVPKKLSDYEIPLRYTRGGKRNGVEFSPITVNQPMVAYKQPVSGLHLWTVHRDAPSGVATALAYRWGEGSSYFIDGVANASGAIDPALVQARLDGDDFSDLHATTNAKKKFLIVNEASGLVITRFQGDFLFQAKLRKADDPNAIPYQAWGTTNTFAHWVGDNAWILSMYSGWKQPQERWMVGPDNAPWNVSYNSSAPDMPIHQYGLEWGNAQLFTFENASGGFRTIVTQGKAGVVSVRPTCNVNPCDKPWLAENQDIVQDPYTAGANQRWRIIPLEYIEEIR